jgi:hypothetical protein
MTGEKEKKRRKIIYHSTWDQTPPEEFHEGHAKKSRLRQRVIPFVQLEMAEVGNGTSTCVVASA